MPFLLDSNWSVFYLFPISSFRSMTSLHSPFLMKHWWKQLWAIFSLHFSFSACPLSFIALPPPSTHLQDRYLVCAGKGESIPFHCPFPCHLLYKLSQRNPLAPSSYLPEGEGAHDTRTGHRIISTSILASFPANLLWGAAWMVIAALSLAVKLSIFLIRTPGFNPQLWLLTPAFL